MSNPPSPIAPAFAVPIELRLLYAHGLGELSPYFAGLQRGMAWATRCRSCNKTWFAPRLVCTCGACSVDWVELTGRGIIAAMTRGRAMLPGTTIVNEFNFALIRIEGADNLYFGRLGGAPGELAPRSVVRLRLADGEWAHPAQCVEFVLDTMPLRGLGPPSTALSQTPGDALRTDDPTRDP